MTAPLITPAIILSQPQMGENVGAAARAMKNFGLSELRLVAPKCGWPNDKAQMVASGAGDIIERTQIFESTAAALADFQLVLATTARDRDIVREILTPDAAATRLRQAAREGVRTAILFGGERAGLTNEEMDLADAAITIPTAEFSSLNLGQAVLLLGYEWLKAADATPPSRTRSTIAKPASRFELTGLFEHLEKELDAAEFLYPPAKKDTMVRNIRALLQRARPTDQEVATFHGIIAYLATKKRKG